MGFVERPERRDPASVHGQSTWNSCRPSRPNWGACAGCAGIVPGTARRLAAKAATTTIPIVFARSGAIRSRRASSPAYNRPGGNVTRTCSYLAGMLGAKRLEICCDSSSPRRRPSPCWSIRALPTTECRSGATCKAAAQAMGRQLHRSRRQQGWRYRSRPSTCSPGAAAGALLVGAGPVPSTPTGSASSRVARPVMAASDLCNNREFCRSREVSCPTGQTFPDSCHPALC